MNSSIYKILLLIVFVGAIFSANAQSFVVSGKVVDENDEPLPGVNVIVVNQQDRFVNGTVTNANGDYKIGLTSRNYSLVFSFIGLKTQKISIGASNVLHVTLESVIEEVEEVTVVAEERSNDNFNPVAIRDLSTAVDRMEMSEVDYVPAASLGDVLQGQMANMDIVSSSGEPGAGMSIRIRGTTSMNASSDPLFVVDGIPYETNIDDDFDFAVANEEDYGSLVNLPPEDIQSIQLLKDAGATAIWGSAGANGVILIETKRGKKGKTRVSYSLKINVNTEPEQIPMLTGDQFVSYMQEAYWNHYNTIGWGGAMAIANTLHNGIDELSFNPSFQYFNEYNQNTNWLEEITQTGIGQNHNLSVSGGGDKARYRLSFGYTDEEGTTVGTGFQRLSTVWNIDYRLSNRMTLSSDFSLVHGDRQSNYALSGNVRQNALNRMPNVSPYYYDEQGNVTDDYFQLQQDWQGKSVDGFYNAIALANDAYSNTMNNRARTSLKLRYRFSNVFSLNALAAFDYSTTESEQFLPQTVTGVPWNNANSNKAVEGSVETFVVNTQTQLYYTPSLGEDHELTGVLGLMTKDRKNTTFQGSLSGLGSEHAADPSSEGKIRSINSGQSQNRSVGILTNWHYMYKGRYILSANVMGDGNSKFGGGSRWGVFPSFSAGWRLSKEWFIKDANWIEDLKVRGSYGIVGNAPTSSYGYYGAYGSAGQYVDMDAIRPNSIQLDQLQWETVTQGNIGLDFFGFKNNVELHAEVYRKTTEDMLYAGAKIPSTSGYPKVDFLNYGTMRNSGWEFSGNWTVYRNTDWRVRLNWNIAQNFNEIMDYPDNVPLEQYTFGNGNYASRIVIGTPLGSFFGYEYMGVYKNKEETIVRGKDGEKVYGLDGKPVYMSANNYTFQPGDARYNDTNFDGVIDKYDLTYLGNAMPTLTGGLGTYVAYKGLALNVFFHFRTGQDVVNRTRMVTENMYGKNNQSAAVIGRWRQPGDETDMPRALYNAGYNWLGSSRFVEDASYMRLKVTTLSYTLPKQTTKKIGLSRMKMFLTGYDLLTFTNYSGQDPEVSVGGKNPFRLGYDNQRTPRPVRYAFGLNIEL